VVILKKKSHKIILFLCILFSIFALGLFFGLNSWNKKLYVQWHPSQERRIAVADSSAEILNLSYNQLSQKASLALFSQNKVTKENGLRAFYLGNFLVQNPVLKKHRFICQIFPLVEFTFSAVGINLSGEEGLMVIQSPCNMEDENLIGPFWIPYQEILANPSQNFFELPEQKTSIRFYNTSPSLVQSWLLINVQFFLKDQPDDSHFLVRFAPGAENPYFELNLNDSESVKEPTEKPAI